MLSASTDLNRILRSIAQLSPDDREALIDMLIASRSDAREEHYQDIDLDAAPDLLRSIARNLVNSDYFIDSNGLDAFNFM